MEAAEWDRLRQCSTSVHSEDPAAKTGVDSDWISEEIDTRAAGRRVAGDSRGAR